MKLSELIDKLEEARRLDSLGEECVASAEDSTIILQNTAHDVLIYLRSIQELDRKGNVTDDTAPTSYGMFNARRVLWGLGLNDNMSDSGVEEDANRLAGHLQEAYETGKKSVYEELLAAKAACKILISEHSDMMLERNEYMADVKQLRKQLADDAMRNADKG